MACSAATEQNRNCLENFCRPSVHSKQCRASTIVAKVSLVSLYSIACCQANTDLSDWLQNLRPYVRGLVGHPLRQGTKPNLSQQISDHISQGLLPTFAVACLLLPSVSASDMAQIVGITDHCPEPPFPAPIGNVWRDAILTLIWGVLLLAAAGQLPPPITP